MSQAEGVAKFIRGASSACASDPDAELVRRFVSGDEAAFRALVSRYAPIVWAVCRRLARNHHDAEDAFQATLLVFARKAGGLRTGAAVGGWLHAVAYRVAARVRATRRAEPADVEPTAGPAGGALDELTVREAEAALHEELARLPEKYRAPLLLCCLDGLSRDEAAQRLGWSANRVKHGLEQGRELLRVRLAHRGIALGVTLFTGLVAAPARAVPPTLAETAVRLATGTAPPAAVDSLAAGVTRTMWLSKWKWPVVGCAALFLTASGVLVSGFYAPPEVPALPGAKAEPVFVPAAPESKRPAPEPKKELPREPIDIAAAYLQAVIDGKPEQAQKFGDNLNERYIKELQVAGLKQVNFALVLANNARVQVVTERAKLKRQPDAEAADGHVVVVLERPKPGGPWFVRESDVADEGKVLREIDHYLEGDYNAKKPAPPAPRDAPDPPTMDPIPGRAVASEFLKLVHSEKDADALKLCVPGGISENKLGEIRKAGFAVGIDGPTFVAVLVNDSRVEVVSDRQPLTLKGTEKKPGHLVLTLTKSKVGAWVVKDIDFRDEDKVEERVKLYLDGKYNVPSTKP
jgi:RNA polymerase sigma factor (sigma-70 family)